MWCFLIHVYHCGNDIFLAYTVNENQEHTAVTLTFYSPLAPMKSEGEAE